jgi:TatD DNase family protein
MLIETDSPYLSPDPFRGKSNEPANVKIVAEAVASIKQISLKEVANFTTANFKKFFLNETN